MRDFAGAVGRQVADHLGSRGFVGRMGSYVRDLPTGVRHGILFDNAGRGPQAFLVMLSVSCPQVDGDICGGYLVRYFTGGSLADSPRNLPCPSLAALTEKLSRFVATFDSVVEPFLSGIGTRQALADSLRNHPGLAGYRGRLYLLDGLGDQARGELESARGELDSRPDADAGEVLAARAELESLLKRCGESAL